MNSMTRRFARCYSAWMPPKPPKLEALIKALTAEGVRFVVIGRLAIVLHGGRTTAMESEFALATDAENRMALIRALAPLRPRPWNWDEATPFVWDVRSIFGSNISLNTTAGDVDLLLEIPGVDSLHGLLSRSMETDLGGVLFQVASVDDLIAMKRVANRPHDQVHLAELARISKVRKIEGA